MSGWHSSISSQFPSMSSKPERHSHSKEPSVLVQREFKGQPSASHSLVSTHTVESSLSSQPGRQLQSYFIPVSSKLQLVHSKGPVRPQIAPLSTHSSMSRQPTTLESSASISSKPSQQVHEKLPEVFSQSVLAPQLARMSSHSFISSQVMVSLALTRLKPELQKHS